MACTEFVEVQNFRGQSGREQKSRETEDRVAEVQSAIEQRL